jgi:acyl transferase domain-containing protein
MLPLGHDYAEAVYGEKKRFEENGIHDDSPKYPYIPSYSSVTPDKDITTSGQHIPTSYWGSNLRFPVRFTEALSKLLSSEDLGIGALIEIGPHPALKSPVGHIVKALGKSIPHLGSLKRGEDSRKSLLELAGTLFALNTDVNLLAVNAVDEKTGGKLAHGSTAVDLPPYQYNYGPVKYHENRASKEYRLRKVPHHHLLGSRIAGTTRLRPQYRNMLRVKDLPWLDNHRVPPHVLHPRAAHIVMAMLAAEQLTRTSQAPSPSRALSFVTYPSKRLSWSLKATTVSKSSSAWS